MKFILRVLINAAALWVTAYLIDDIQLTDDLLNVLVVALLFGLVNTFIRPIVALFSLPLTLLTLGLFSLVINAVMLLLTAWLSSSLSIEGGFWGQLVTAFVGSIIISIVSAVLNRFVGD